MQLTKKKVVFLSRILKRERESRYSPVFVKYNLLNRVSEIWYLLRIALFEFVCFLGIVNDKLTK